MAYTTINKSTDYFNTKLYTGNGGTQAVTGVGFQPDWVWLKSRSDAYSHQLFDAVRGTTKLLTSEATDAEQTISGVTAFGTDGFTVGSDAGSNGNTKTYVSWNWKAGTGQGSANTDGSINTTYTSVNTTAGFSISKYTGTGSNATVGHGLGVAPNMVLVKSLSGGGDWTSYHSVLGNTKYMRLNSTNAVGTQSSYWNDTSPTSTVFSLGSAGDTNTNNGTHVAYCFAEKTGYSKFGSYVGNGSNDGTFVYTGFKPAFVIVKRTDATQSWYLLDNKRNTFNPEDKYFKVDETSAEDTHTFFDFISNGFKTRGTGIGYNASGGSYIYMAFAEAPLVGSNGVTAKAR